MYPSTRSPFGALRALARAGVCVALLGCGATEGSTFVSNDPAGPSTPESSATQNSWPKSVVCGVTEVGDSPRPEIYMLTAMNNKLRLYPELAAAVGMNEVSDCESARAFYAGLVRYRVDHPDFDAHQPLDSTPVELPAPPPPSDEVIEENKIFNGTSSEANHSVVRLDFRFSTTKVGVPRHPLSNQLQHCSGTFITKNWILTAAHCITPPAVDHCVKDGTPITPGACVPIWNVYGVWTMQTDVDLPRRVRAHAFVHPDWIGLTPASNDLFVPRTPAEILESASHDIALLYLPDQGSLPGNVEADRAMRLWIAGPDVDSPSLTFWGWGLPDRTLLKAALASDLVFTAFTNQIGARTTTPGSSLPCKGDSGGPLVKNVTIVDNALMTRTVPALMGVTSIGIDPCPTFSNPPPLGRDTRWARIDTELPFIEARMKLHLGRRFECLKLTQTGGTVAEVGECWGSPCKQTAECAFEDEFCYMPGRDFNNQCPVCSNAPGCGCIIGQCLKKF